MCWYTRIFSSHCSQREFLHASLDNEAIQNWDLLLKLLAPMGENSFLKELTPITWRINENGKVVSHGSVPIDFNPIALKKVKIVYNFDLSECNRVTA